MYTIYYNNKDITVCDYSYKPLQDKSTLICFHNADLRDTVSDFLEGDAFRTLVIVCEKLTEGWKDFRSIFKEVKAGGGLISNADGDCLMIFRLGVWDLPKGKQERGEKIEETALREVQEECGIPAPKLGKKICVTHHIYHRDGLVWLKHTYWYRMFSDGVPALKPQTEEDIASAVWIPASGVPDKAALSYPSIREVLSSLSL